MMRNIVAGNWKSNKSINEARNWMSEMGEAMDNLPKNVRIMVAVPAPYLAALANEKHPRILIASQQVSATGHGAFTGEFTADMLVSCGVDYALVGHSERRSNFGETDEIVSEKLKQCTESGLGVVLCCGEHLNERDAERQEEVIKRQLESALHGVTADDMKDVIVAYEPIWAIGTGRTATSDQAAEMHTFIRRWISEKFNRDTAENTSVLYGGSCKPSNAKELFASKDVDGGLIGGASLNSGDFQSLICSFT
ncbi:MAG: triose-phosphate isomerase [Bacteroidetes bacterium]|jgi:triosephosphate isomerase (TIM)|nr:triose-phosphate isomerase [Bacteroidota bacterium]